MWMIYHPRWSFIHRECYFHLGPSWIQSLCLNCTHWPKQHQLDINYLGNNREIPPEEVLLWSSQRKYLCGNAKESKTRVTDSALLGIPLLSTCSFKKKRGKIKSRSSVVWIKSEFRQTIAEFLRQNSACESISRYPKRRDIEKTSPKIGPSRCARNTL